MEKINIKSNSLVRVIKESRAQWGLLILVIALYILSGLFISSSANMLGNIVDFGTAGQIQPMINTAVILLLVVVANSVATLFQHRITGIATERMFLNIRLRAFASILTAKFSILENDMRTSDVAVRVNTNTDNLCEMFAGAFSWFSRIILQSIIALVSCLLISWQLTFIYIILLAVSLYIIKKISVPIQKQTKSAAEATGRSLNVALDMLSGLSVIKSFQVEREMTKRYAKHVNANIMQNKKMQSVNFKMTLVKYLSNVIQLMVIISVAFFLTTRGFISVGQVVTFIILSAAIGDTFGLSDKMLSTYRRAFSLADRVYEIIDLPAEQGGENLIPNGSLCVSMENISFRYKEDITVLSNVSIKLAQSQKIGIIGSSGSGKSSILKLLCKFYDYKSQAGTFFVLGHELNKWGFSPLRKHLAIVTQDALLFSGTVYENLLMGNENATKTQVIKALKDVQLWDFVKTMKDGIHSDIGEEGAKLSIGQRQRLSIARAILKDADIVLLDEPTSALDTFTETEIQKALDIAFKDKAVITVSHRLSAINNVDYIYCMDNGKVIEEGSSIDLLDKKGYFYNINAQQKLGDKIEGI